MLMKAFYMDSRVNICRRAMLTAKAVPAAVSTASAEVLTALRKQGATRKRHYLFRGIQFMTAGKEDMTIYSGVARTFAFGRT